MGERALQDRWKLLAASFSDSAAGGRWRERLGPDFREAVDLLVFVLGTDVGFPPAEIDGQQLGSVLATLLPGRVAGEERYRHDLPDLLEEFLLHVVSEEGLTCAWEWTSALNGHRSAYDAALRNPSRPVPAGAPKRVPDRRPSPKLGRNDPCFCGSGRKFKHCCGRF